MLKLCAFSAELRKGRMLRQIWDEADEIQYTTVRAFYIKEVRKIIWVKTQHSKAIWARSCVEDLWGLRSIDMLDELPFETSNMLTRAFTAQNNEAKSVNWRRVGAFGLREKWSSTIMECNEVIVQFAANESWNQGNRDGYFLVWDKNRTSRLICPHSWEGVELQGIENDMGSHLLHVVQEDILEWYICLCREIATSRYRSTWFSWIPKMFNWSSLLHLTTTIKEGGLWGKGKLTVNRSHLYMKL